jgi:hypothetical protein
MKAKSSGPPEPKYIDRPEITEVFADRLEHLFLDGGLVRLEFTVVRTDPAQTVAGQPIPEPRQWSYTAARIVLSVRGVAEMLNKMQELQTVLLRQGLLQPRQGAPAGGGPAAEPPPPAEPAP